MNLTALRTIPSIPLTNFDATKTAIRLIAHPKSQLILFIGTLAAASLVQNSLFNKSNSYKEAEKWTQLSIRAVALIATTTGLVALSPYLGWTRVTAQFAIRLGIITTIIQGIFLSVNSGQNEEKEALVDTREQEKLEESFREKFLSNRAIRKQQNVDQMIDNWLQKVKLKVKKRRAALEEAIHKRDIDTFTNKVAIARSLRTKKHAEQLIHHWFEKTRTKLEKQRTLAAEEAAKKHQEMLEDFQKRMLTKNAEKEAQTKQKANLLIDTWFQKATGKLQAQRLALTELKKQKEAEETARQYQEQIQSFRAKQLAKREVQIQQKAVHLIHNWFQKTKANLQTRRALAANKKQEQVAPVIQVEPMERAGRRTICHLLEEKTKALFNHMIWNRLTIRFIRKSRSK